MDPGLIRKAWRTMTFLRARPQPPRVPVCVSRHRGHRTHRRSDRDRPRRRHRHVDRAAQSFDPDLRKLVNEIDPGRIQSIITTLAGFGTRHTASSQTDPNRGIGAAIAYVTDLMNQIAATSSGRMTVQQQTFIQPPSSTLAAADVDHQRHRHAAGHRVPRAVLRRDRAPRLPVHQHPRLHQRRTRGR